MEKVSLYIPCYNAQEYIKECLESVIAQTYPIDEILIINDGSTDKTVEIASAYPVTVINHKENKGLAATRNTAFKRARNEFIASLDADCLATPNWLEKLMEHFKDHTVAGAGGRLAETYTFGCANKWRSVHMNQDWGDTLLENPTFLYGSNNVYKAEVIKNIGFFNEKYISNYEDVDISKRLIKNGHTLVYDPGALASHLRKDTIASVLNTSWNWTFFDLPVPYDRNNFLRKMLHNLKFGLSLGIRDIFKGNFTLMHIDCMLPFYYSFFDYKFLKSKRA